MAHKYNAFFRLNTAFNDTSADCVEAYNILKQSNIKFEHAHYFPPEHANGAIEVVRQYPDHENVNFPYVTYEKGYDVDDEPPREQIIVNGLEEIKSIDWAELASFRG